MLDARLLAPFSPALGLAVADFLGAILGGPALLSPLDPGAVVADFLFFFGISDSEAEEAELLVVRVVGKALVLGLRDGTFLAFFLDLSSAELLEDLDEAELLELFLDLDEFCELDESSVSLELSSLPELELELELEEELPDEELPEEADEEALLEPGCLGGILGLRK